jgi:hypothetical protein
MSPPLANPARGAGKPDGERNTRAERKLGGKAEAMPHEPILAWLM